MSLYVSEFWMGITSVSLCTVPEVCYYLLSEKEKPLFQVDLQVEIGTVTKAEAKKENVFLLHNGPKCAQISLE